MKNTKAIKAAQKVARKAGKNLGLLNRMSMSFNAPTLLAFFDNGVVAVALDTLNFSITTY